MDKRIDSEKNLAARLGNLDLGVNEKDAVAFEALLEVASSKPALSNWLKGLILLLPILLATIFYFTSDFGKADKTQDKISVSEVKVTDEQEAIQIKSIQSNDQEVETVTEKIVNQIELNKPNPEKESAFAVNQEKIISYPNNHSSLASEFVRSGSLFNTSIINDKLEKALGSERRQELTAFQLLPSLTPTTIGLFNSDPPLLESKPSILPEQKRESGFSFGFSLETGQVLAGPHETPFVSEFPTSIKGDGLFGGGVFGVYKINRAHSIRMNLKYIRSSQQQIVHDLRFASTMPGEPLDFLTLESIAHELRPGIDYLVDLNPFSNGVHFKLGFGMSYGHLFSSSSNNYYDQLVAEVDEKNEVDISPLGMKTFFALEEKFSDNLILGIEPYLLYQKRTVRYTPSVFLADKGDYNYQIGVNLRAQF